MQKASICCIGGMEYGNISSLESSLQIFWFSAANDTLTLCSISDLEIGSALWTFASKVCDQKTTIIQALLFY